MLKLLYALGKYIRNMETLWNVDITLVLFFFLIMFTFASCLISFISAIIC